MDNKTYKLLVGAVITSLLAIITVIVVVITLNSSSSNNNASPKASPTATSALTFSPDPGTPWNKNMVLGDFDKAQNHFVEYSDPMCGYCGKFSLALIHNKTELYSKYIDNNKMSLEVRLTDMLQQEEKDNSKRAAEYAYCAADQNNFHNYYDNFMNQMNKDYFSRGIGAYHGAPEIPHLEDSYYDSVALSSGLDQGKLSSCLSSGQGETDVLKATMSAKQAVTSGLPSFVFNSFTTSGFNGDWPTIEKMFSAGGI
ncbi:MAG: DsbA family protein [Bifidobacteriaceae bacterium]|jgi:protein-disulfide isomerase|nr:DsbA family protein [Bifidobacteriaceae bacterium]